jgi:AmmeMemoRadiSam system protein A
MHTLLQTGTTEYSKQERIELLRLAHQSIDAALEGRNLTVPPPSPHLAEKRGAFTTLHLGGRLRGCIGYVDASNPLYETVIETAAAAALQDPRFVPVNVEEAKALQIEISVMSPMFPIQPEEVVIGKHGLLVTHRGRRGLLLPQVPLEWGWNREQFLTQLCYKAGLPGDAWQRGAQLEAFTAEVFGEETPVESLEENHNNQN